MCLVILVLMCWLMLSSLFLQEVRGCVPHWRPIPSAITMVFKRKKKKTHINLKHKGQQSDFAVSFSKRECTREQLFFYMLLFFISILMQVQEKVEQAFGEENLKMNLVNI